MKKMTLFFALMLAVGMTGLQAQACSKSKAACAKSTTASAKSCHGTNAAAAKLASMDDSIEERVCPNSGNVSYVRKEVSEQSGEVSFASVNYDTELGKFVNQAPSDKKACCDKDKATGCCSKGVTATEASSKKACDPAACTKKVTVASVDKSKT